MRKRLSTFFILFFIVSALCCFMADKLTYDVCIAENSELDTKDVTRLHIIGADNSVEAQRLKYELRDYLCDYFSDISTCYCEKAEFDELCQKNIEVIQNAANLFLQEKGVLYKATVIFTKCYFPLRMYGDLLLPAGIYDAVEVVLGEGKGNNWWCVLFPNGCYKKEQRTVRYRSRLGEWLGGLLKKN